MNGLVWEVLVQESISGKGGGTVQAWMNIRALRFTEPIF
jgi:hypothetical protein